MKMLNFIKFRENEKILHFHENELKSLKLQKWTQNTIEFHWFNNVLRQVAQKVQNLRKLAK